MGWIVLVLICWLALCFFVAKFAHRKGRSAIGFFWLSVFLSPLFGFIAALIAEENTSNIVASGYRKKCPYCAELIKPEAKVCRYCGKELPEQTDDQNSDELKKASELNKAKEKKKAEENEAAWRAQQKREEGVEEKDRGNQSIKKIGKKCLECGYENDIQSERCPHCGRYYGKEESPTNKTGKTNNKPNIKQCMKCGYIRKLDDGNPRDLCPKCGAVYAKVEKLLEEKRKAVLEKKRTGNSSADTANDRGQSEEW